MNKKILITGGAGFIGSNFIHYLLKNTDYEILNLDALTYAGNLENLRNVKDDKRYGFIKCDIRIKDDLKKVFAENEFYGVINFAAESHVDRSILEPAVFIDTNVKGTLNLLQMSLEARVSRFLQISTDEVYGELEKPRTSHSRKTLKSSRILPMPHQKPLLIYWRSHLCAHIKWM
jgi:dTDP-glucose 4,6-dehydratase